MKGFPVGVSKKRELLLSSGGLDYRDGKPSVSMTHHRHMRTYCPICERRAFDVSEGKPGSIGIIMKCPNCHKFVMVCIKNPLY